MYDTVFVTWGNSHSGGLRQQQPVCVATASVGLTKHCNQETKQATAALVQGSDCDLHAHTCVLLAHMGLAA
jgi:hypothetical protein